MKWDTTSAGEAHLINDEDIYTGWMIQRLSKADLEQALAGEHSHVAHKLKPGWYISTPPAGYPEDDAECLFSAHIMGWVFPTRKAAQSAVLLLRATMNWEDNE
jgi:hypothetical protein